jgi:hypothetical protein
MRILGPAIRQSWRTRNALLRPRLSSIVLPAGLVSVATTQACGQRVRERYYVFGVCKAGHGGRRYRGLCVHHEICVRHVDAGRSCQEEETGSEHGIGVTRARSNRSQGFEDCASEGGYRIRCL